MMPFKTQIHQIEETKLLLSFSENIFDTFVIQCYIWQINKTHDHVLEHMYGTQRRLCKCWCTEK